VTTIANTQSHATSPHRHVARSINEASASTTALMREARLGSQAAWEAIVDRYSGLVWATVRGTRLAHDDAVDAAQTTWLRLVEHIDLIRDPEHLGAWLATTARRESIRLIRQSAYERPTDEADLFEASSDETSDARLLAAERAAALRGAVSQLPGGSQRLLGLLFCPSEPSYAEIAVRIGMPVGAIGPTRLRCLQRLSRDRELARLVA
jgi:RNA polymerase sigma factor (sigma-70 family)